MIINFSISIRTWNVVYNRYSFLDRNVVCFLLNQELFRFQVTSERAVRSTGLTFLGPFNLVRNTPHFLLVNPTVFQRIFFSSFFGGNTLENLNIH